VSVTRVLRQLNSLDLTSFCFLSLFISCPRVSGAA